MLNLKQQTLAKSYFAMDTAKYQVSKTITLKY